jgi:hypothetical protein
MRSTPRDRDPEHDVLFETKKSRNSLSGSGSASVPKPLGPQEPSQRWWWLVLVAVWAISGLYAANGMLRGWVPHDEGMLGQSAERILVGELPHRDFDDPYTGGLSYLHALAFRLLGINLVSLRWVLLLFVLAWLPAVYYVASCLVSPITAAGVVLLAVVWSVPNYFASLPSWYNLFLAVFGAAFLFRHLETGARKWLLASGVCAGLSCLIKIAGLYYVAAVLLFLFFREQSTSASDRGPKKEWGYTLFLASSLLALLALLVGLVHSRPKAVDVIHFVLPGAALTVPLLWREWRKTHLGDRERFRLLGRLLGPFALGIAAPVGIFMLPYFLSGGLPSLFHNVFVAPARRFTFGSMEAPGLSTLAAAFPLAGLFGLVLYGRRVIGRFAGGLMALALIALLVFSDNPVVYRAVWYSVRPLVPLTVLAGVALLIRGEGLSELRRQQIMLLLSLAGMCSLVQFPFAAPVYFLYVTPLLVLAIVAFFSDQTALPRLLIAAALGFYFLFALMRVNPGFIYQMGSGYVRDDQTELLALERAGIRVNSRSKQQYEQLVATLRHHASGGFTYATPDCPEVYFLAGLRNPTRTIFEFLDSSSNRTSAVLEALNRHRVRAIALNRAPEFSGAPPLDLAAALVQRFPNAMMIGKFEVRWIE